MQTFILSLGKSYFRSFQGLSKPAWRGVVLSLIDSTLIGIYYFLSIYFLKVLNFSVTTCGIIISCHGLGAIVGSFCSGKLSDRVSPTLISAISLLIQAIGYFALVKLHTVEWVMFDTFILGAASYGFITSNHLWTLHHSTEDERLKAINLLSTASNLGFSLSAIIMGAMISFGFHSIFIIVGSITLLLSCFLFTQDASQRKDLNFSMHGNMIQKQGNEAVHPHKKNNRMIIFIMLACVLLTGCTVSQLGSTYPIYIQATYPWMGVQAVSILFAVNSLVVVLVEAPLGTLFNKQNKMLMLGLGALLIGIGMCALTLSSFFILAVLSCVIYTLGEIIFFCMAQLLCYEYGAAGKKGSSVGMYRMVYATSRVIGPTAGGFIYYHVSGEMVWVISGMIGLVCFMTCYPFMNLTRHHA